MSARRFTEGLVVGGACVGALAFALSRKKVLPRSSSNKEYEFDVDNNSSKTVYLDDGTKVTAYSKRRSSGWNFEFGGAADIVGVGIACMLIFPFVVIIS